VKRLRRWLKHAAIGVVVLLLLLGVAWIFRWELLGGTIRSALREVLVEQGIRIHVDGIEGSLVADVTATGIRTEATTDDPFLREGRIERVRVTYSLPALLTGQDGWLGDIVAEGVTAVVDLHAPLPAPADSGTPDGKARAILPRRVRVIGANLTILSGPNRLTVDDGEVRVDMSSGRELRGTIGAGRITAVVDGEEHDLGAPRATVLLDGETLRVLAHPAGAGPLREVVRADLARLEEGYLDADVDLLALGGRIRGTVRSELDEETVTADLALTDLRPRALLRFLPRYEADLELISGNLTATFAGVETPWWKTLTGRFDLLLAEPSVRRWSANRIEIEGTFEDRVFRVRGRTVDPGSTFDGTLALGDDPRVEATLLLADFDAAVLDLEFGGRDVRGVANGTARISGPVSAPEFAVDLEVFGPGFGEWSADRVAVVAKGDTEDVELTRLALIRGTDRIEVEGTASFGAALRFDASGSLDVKSAAGIAALFGREASADLDAEVRLVFSAKSTGGTGTRVTVSDLFIDAGLVRATGTGIEVSLPAFSGGPFEHRRIGATGTIALEGIEPEGIAARFELPSVAAGTLSGKVRFEGTVGQPDVALTLAGESIEFRPPGRDVITADRVAVAARFDPSGPALTELFVGGETWRITASGRMDWNPLAAEPGSLRSAPLTGRMDLVDVPLDLTGAIPMIAVARGRTSAEVSLTGSLRAPRAEGRITVRAEEIRPDHEQAPPVENLDLTIMLSGAGTSGVFVEVPPSSAEVLGAKVRIESASTRVSFDPVRFEEPRLSARITGIDARRVGGWFGDRKDVEGILDLSLDLARGPAIVVTARARDIRIEGDDRIEEISPPGTLDLTARWRDGLLSVTDGVFVKGRMRLSIDAEVPVEIAFDPPRVHRPPDGKILVSATAANVDLAPLAKTIEGDLRFGGVADVTLSLGGTHRAPEKQARVTVRDGFFRAPGAPPIDEVNGSLRFTGDGILHVDGLRARMGRRRVTVPEGGYVRLSPDEHGDLRIEDVHLAVSGKNVLLLRQRTMLIRGAPDLELTGGGDSGLLLSGTLEIGTLRYTQRIELVSRQPSLAPLPLTGNPFLSALRLDLTVIAPKESIRVRNNLLDAELSGRLRILGTAAVPRPEGRIIADRGSIRLPTVTMKLIHAAAEFRRERPLQPRIDALLAANINRITVNLSAKGPVNNLEINTSSVPSLPEEDVITLLATGELPADVETGTAAGMAATLLYRQIVSEMAGADPDDETSAIEDLAGRVEEFTVDTASLFGGGGTAWRATVRIIDDWLYLRADQTDAFNYGLDILIRLSLR